ncbi:MAG: hypothetical protein M1833_001072 [Piccolia ochrophora]|nr:MAG: hypothetical protein M1833_001072 [Piccolia ochrophora]
MGGKRAIVPSVFEPCYEGGLHVVLLRHPVQPLANDVVYVTDEPRRSGRATKGQHTKNVEPATNTSKSSKAKSSKSNKGGSAQEEGDEDEGNDIIRCVCGATEEDEDDEKMMICCDKCGCWQHNECMEITEDEDALPEKYLCEQCDPEGHKSLLEKMAKGEKPWEDRAHEREQEEQKKGRKKKGGKKGAEKKAKPAEAAAEPQQAVNGGNEPAVDDTKSPANAQDVQVSPPLEPPPTPTTLASGQKRKAGGEVKIEASPESKEQQSKVRKLSSQQFKDEGVKIEKPPAQRRASTQVQAPKRRDSKEIPNQTELVTSPDQILNDARKSLAKHFIKIFQEVYSRAIKAKTYALPEGATIDSVATRLGLRVELSLHMNHSDKAGDPAPAYRDRFRTMTFNLKKNPALGDRLIHDSLSPDDFSTMSTDEMASKELQERTAEMKREAEKQHILIQEEGPRIRRTHKGEEVVGDEREHGNNESIFTPAPPRRRESMAESDAATAGSPSQLTMSPSSPAKVEHPELQNHNGAVSPGHSYPLNVDTGATLHDVMPDKRSSSSAFNIQDVWSSVHSPDAEKARLLRQPPKRRSSGPVKAPGQASAQASGGAIDSEIDQLLNDEDVESPPYSPTDYQAGTADREGEQPITWRGDITMQGVASFSATAQHVAGADLSSTIPWTTLIPSSISIDGRINLENCNEYLCGLRWSRTTDVVVIALTRIDDPSSDEAFTKLWSYFTKRQRYGVIGKLPLPQIKDAYVIPVDAGTAKLPTFMEMLEHNTLPDARAEPLLLIAFVVRAAAASGTAGSPPNTGTSGGPHYQPTITTPGPMAGSAISPIHHTMPSPASAGRAASQPFSTPLPPHHALAPAAITAQRVLGLPLADCLVVRQLVEQSTAIDEAQFAAIKDILERVPAAQTDLGLLSQLLMEKGAAEGR